ncbi:MAG: amidohydrolase family protein [Henriciella sp.]|nr:amidohydrolase family protein [Henriciella sp.]
MAGQDPHSKIDLIGFNLKMLAKGHKRSLLISAGALEDKQYLLEVCQKMAGIGVGIYATPGTHRFLAEHGVASIAARKISSVEEPNIAALIEDGKVDFVVNILTGDTTYDEASDAASIRSLSVRHGIPLYTDRAVARETIELVLKDFEEGTYSYQIRSEDSPWDLKARFLELVRQRGGFSNHHGHFDKAYLISPENLALGFADMEKKWELYRHLKENYTHEDLVERISRALETVYQQGAQYCRTMVDADSIIDLKAIHAAVEVKDRYKDKIRFEIGVQPLEGLIDETSRAQYLDACKLADFCGGLPSRDRPQEAAHLDIVMQTAKDLNKMVEVHVDQENNPYQNETELLCLKTIEHGMQGRVYGIHSISVAAKDESEQNRIIELCKQADIGIVICPSAALSMRQLPMTAPLHNSIGPFVKMKEAGVRTYLGIDNINDLFMPIVDGDMWTEVRVLMEACRYYDLEQVADWASQPPLHVVNADAARVAAE